MLTERQQTILRSVKKLSDALGMPPTLKEIGDDVYLSIFPVRNTIIELAKLGFVKRLPHQPRTITIIRMPAETRAAH